MAEIPCHSHLELRNAIGESVMSVACDRKNSHKVHTAVVRIAQTVPYFRPTPEQPHATLEWVDGTRHQQGSHAVMAVR